MRQRWTGFGIVVFALATGCKSNAEAGAAASASAAVQGTASVQARIGGTVIAAGDHAVEVLVHGNGLVEALVMDAKGELIADPPSIKLAVTVEAKGGARPLIDLKWDPIRARFVGRAAAGIELVPGNVDVALDVKGVASVGHMANVALAVGAVHGGQVIMVGNYSVELVSKGGFVQAFVFDASGKAHVDGNLDLKLDIGGKPVVLVWDAASLSYKAKLDAGLDIDAKPVALRLAADGKVAVGAVQSFKADVNAAANLAANVDAKLGAAVNVKAPDVSAQVEGLKNAAASAKASIKAPTLDVSFNKSASAGATAGTKTGTAAKGSAKAGFSLGTK